MGKTHKGQPFSCANKRFHTDTSKGRPHGASPTLGSVFDKAICVNSDNYSLWFEHVVDTYGGWEPFWLMWYNPAGTPTISMSATFDRSQIQDIVSRLSSFIEIK